MAKKKAAAKAQPGRPILIGLRGSEEYADWLESIHKKTLIPKAVILRVALKTWAEANGHELPPER